jgi:hypothetical protein
MDMETGSEGFINFKIAKLANGRAVHSTGVCWQSMFIILMLMIAFHLEQ